MNWGWLGLGTEGGGGVGSYVVVEVLAGELDGLGDGVGGGRVAWVEAVGAHGQVRGWGWCAVDSLGVAEGVARLVLDFERVEAAVVEEETEDDGQEGGDGARTDDDTPDAVGDLFAFCFVERVEAALFLFETVGGFVAEEDPDTHELGEGLTNGLHEKHGGDHSGPGGSAGPFRRDDTREGIFSTDACVVRARAWFQGSLGSYQHPSQISTEMAAQVRHATFEEQRGWDSTYPRKQGKERHAPHARARRGHANGRDNDEDELDAIQPSSAISVGQVAKGQLTTD